MILCSTTGFYGSVVDKTVVTFDGSVTAIRNGKYDDYEYDLYDDSGVKVRCKGGAMIVDGGYMAEPTMMEPTKNPVDDDDSRWSEMVESLRKDIECTFGELKACFAILKYGPRFGDLDLVDNIFITCCAMHNQRKAPWFRCSMGVGCT